MTHGRLIVFEGSEGAGKTTQIRRLSERLAALGMAYATFREPGGTPPGDVIRELLLDPARVITSRAEALLFMASRAQLVERELVPRLAAGEIVILDRFFLSTYAYQIAGRGLPEREVRAANALATAGLVPDLTLLLTVPAPDRRARAALRGGPDRMERAGDDFHERVDRAFAACLEPGWQAAHPECGPIAAVSGEGAEDEVAARVVHALAARWPETFSVLAASGQSSDSTVSRS